MKLNHTVVVLTFDGNPCTENSGPGQPEHPLTMRSLVVNAINSEIPGGQTSAEEKARIYGLCIKLYSSNDIVILTVEEAALIKQRAGASLLPLFYGRLCDWLENDAETESNETNHRT